MNHFEEDYIRRAMRRGIKPELMLDDVNSAWNPDGPAFTGNVNVIYTGDAEEEITATVSARVLLDRSPVEYRALLELAVKEIDEHNREYRYVTSRRVLKRLRAAANMVVS